MLLAGASFALMGVLVKLGVQWFSSHELVFYRSLIGLFLLLAGMTLRHGLTAGRHFLGEHTRLHLQRGVVGFLALATFFYAVAHLPLSVAITLNYTAPLFLTLLMPWQLNERPTPAQYATVVVGFLGVALLLRPWDSAPGDLVAGLVGLLSGVMAAFAYVHVRRLGRLGEPEWRTVFWFAVVSTLGASVLAGLQGWHAPVTATHYAVLLGVGLFATVGQLAMTRAYRKGDTVVVAAFAYSTVVFGSILDALIFKMEMPITAWIGMLITVLAGVLVSLRTAQLTRNRGK
jgi:drug/metabolite transporter (DMT)-like permease